MAHKNVKMQLFDISADIVGDLPIDIIQKWEMSDKDDKAYRDILLPFEVEGVVVCSDSSGLSKLSYEKHLIEVLKLVNEPKEIIYSYGKIIGGIPIGIWFADNTTMFYNNDIDLYSILTQMIGAQKEIQNNILHIGIGIHHGKFIKINNYIYGEDFSLIDEITESYINGGEILLSRTFCERLSADIFQDLKIKNNLPCTIPFYNFDYTKYNIISTKSNDILYPIPFTKEFYLDLKSANNNFDYDNVFDKYVVSKYIIFIKVHHINHNIFLDNFTDAIIANKYVYDVLNSFSDIQKIKSNGYIGIFISDDIDTAIEFSRSLRDYFIKQKIMIAISITFGDVFIFNIQNDIMEILGSPVNIASKLSEDVSDINAIYIDSSVVNIDNIKGEKYELVISNVKLYGVKI